MNEQRSDGMNLVLKSDGAFASKERRWQWMKKLASLPSSSNDGEEGNMEYVNGMDDEEEARHVHYIWYTLCQNPEVVQT
jgi:hypothetical protein